MAMSDIESIIGGTGVRPSDEENRQLLDITKELFTRENLETKSKLRGADIIIIARALWYGDRYGITEIPDIVQKILLLKRSEGALSLKSFVQVLKNIRPTMEQKEGGDIRV